MVLASSQRSSFKGISYERVKAIFPSGKKLQKTTYDLKFPSNNNLFFKFNNSSFILTLHGMPEAVLAGVAYEI